MVKAKVKDNGNLSHNISIKLIRTEEQKVRTEDDIEHIQNLAISISKSGLLQAVVVCRDGDGYKLVAGKHRLEACRVLGWTEIPANVVQTGKDRSLNSLALVENVVRKDMKISEECKAVKHLNENDKMSVNQIASVLGRTREWVNKRLMAQALPVEVRERLFRGSICLGSAEILGGIEDESIRRSLLFQTIQMELTTEQVRNVAEVYLAAPSMQEAIEEGEKAFSQIQAQKVRKESCGICGVPQEYVDLVNIWICKKGCTPDDLQKQLDSEEGENNGETN